MNQINPTAIELFCGAGGLSYGLHKSGWNILVANDFDKWAIKTHKVNLPNTPLILGDIKSINFKNLRNKITLVAGGPPCQPFSVAGKQLAQFDSRDMVPEYIRVISEVQPKIFLLENVSGLLTKKHKVYFQKIINSLIELDYTINYKLIDAATYGVPQHRKRVIIVGVRKGKGFIFPEPTHGPGTNQPFITSKEALLNAPNDEPNNAKVVYANNPVLRPSPYAGMLVNGQGRPINFSRPSQTIPASAGGYRTPIIDEEGILRKYHEHLIKGGQPFEGEVKGVRRITTREAARLQSFPDEFYFPSPKSIRYKLIGNAVPPKLAYVLGRALLDYLEISEKDSIYPIPKIQLKLPLEK